MLSVLAFWFLCLFLLTDEDELELELLDEDELIEEEDDELNIYFYTFLFFCAYYVIFPGNMNVVSLFSVQMVQRLAYTLPPSYRSSP